VLSLTACGTDPSETPTPSSTVPVSDSIDDIKVTGDFAVEPTIEFTEPFAVDKTMSKVITTAPEDSLWVNQDNYGMEVPEEAFVTLLYYGMDARDKNVFDESWVEPEEEAEDETSDETEIEVEPADDTEAAEAEATEEPPAETEPEATADGRPMAAPTPTESELIEPEPEATETELIEPDPTATETAEPEPTETATVEKTPSPIAFPLGGVIPGFSKGLVGHKVGERVLIAIPDADGYTGGNSSAGIEAGDTLLFVVDIIDTTLAKPDGEAKEAPAGTLAAKIKVKEDEKTGVTLTIPDEAAPTQAQSVTLIEGDGYELGEGMVIVDDYCIYSWNTRSAATPWTVNDITELSEGAVLEGIKKALIGKKVGSRVLMILPPNDGGFEKGSNDPPIEEGDTIVLVVDVLGATYDTSWTQWGAYISHPYVEVGSSATPTAE
jgi:hypothetical protein